MARLTLMQIHTINSMRRNGLGPSAISRRLDISLSAVKRALKKETGDKQREIADRMEHFLGGSTVDSGCYLTTMGGRQREVYDLSDPTFDSVAFEEEMGL